MGLANCEEQLRRQTNHEGKREQLGEQLFKLSFKVEVAMLFILTKGSIAIKALRYLIDKIYNEKYYAVQWCARLI